LNSSVNPMSQMIPTLKEYFESHPNLKYVFYGGKGGVGKTAMAGTTAVWLAAQGKKTLLASTNPVHSLSSLLEQSVFGSPILVQGAENLWAYEIDTKETIEKSKEEIREKIQWFLKFADITIKADDFVESATMNPAFEESAMFENMVDLMLKDEYEVYVFDTAPTANARRLLGMSKVYSLWVDKVLRSREEARSLREILSFTKKKEEDPLLNYLLQFRQRMAQARQRLTDSEKTAFFFVTLPEALPIAVVSRFIGWFHEFGIPVGGVVVNMLLDQEALGDEVPEFILNRIQMQEEHMKSIWEKFDGAVRALVPLFDRDIRGISMLRQAGSAVFGGPQKR
jgi:arsenite-transporting ATPase